jgi:plastocyanin
VEAGQRRNGVSAHLPAGILEGQRAAGSRHRRWRRASRGRDAGDLALGHAWSYMFDTPGEYLCFCRYHADEQMIGMVVVEE